MNKTLLKEYAKMAVEVGVNLQKGQNLIVKSSVEMAEFTRLVVSAGYDRGAKDVIVVWRDDFCDREHWLRADDSLFDGVYPWTADMFNTLAKEGTCYIAIVGEDPERLKGVDQNRQKRFSAGANRDMKDFYSLEMNSAFPWCVISAPIPSWAKKVFPDLPTDEAMEKLWEAILASVHVKEGVDAVSEWKRHSDELKERAKKLNALNFKKVHYKNSIGTDLEVELPEGHRWAGGGDICTKTGIDFSANMPTEETFSAPLRTGVNGTLVASKPLVLNGNVVEGIRFRFEKGRIVEAHADTCEDVLQKAVDTDENSHYLGEIALVPYSSPISQSGILFYETLFDENASCHFAFGEGYPECIEGGNEMTEEELIANGVNSQSSMHVDFMVGTADLSIIGTTHDGKEIPIFVNGDFSI